MQRRIELLAGGVELLDAVAREHGDEVLVDESNAVREVLALDGGRERPLEVVDQSEQHLAEGVRLVHAELVAVLARHGVEAFDPAGESFDPALHEALSVRNEAGADAGRVLDVVEKGYKLDDAVLRPARVVVSG